MNRMRYWTVVTFAVLAALCPAAVKDQKKESLFQNVASVLSEQFFNEEFREKELPKLIERYRGRAANAKDLDAECEIVQKFLSNIPATHTALIKSDSFDIMFDELFGNASPTVGFELIEYDGKQYAFNVLEKGPADVAGLRRGDRIVLIDGVIPSESPRFGWRTDDAFLPDAPVRAVKCAENETVKLMIERTPGKYAKLSVPCNPYSSWEAAKASIRVAERDGKHIGIIHFWLIHMSGPDELLKETLEGRFESCDAVVLDLRGRGGNGMMVPRMLNVLDGTTSNWSKPVVALINEHSRSAKEVIAYEFRKLGLGPLVGERTAGAVIPVTKKDVGFGFTLMFPSFKMPEHTERLEFKGVAPDVVVSEVGPYSAGADPILDAGVAEAARLAGEGPELFAARRAAAAKEYPKSKQWKGFQEAHHTIKTKTSNHKKPEHPDPAGYDAKAMDVWNKMIAAMGGEAAMRRHKYRAIRGKRNMGGMMEGKYEQLAAAPDKRINRMTLGGMAKMETGYNGSIGWTESSNEGVKRMKGDDLTDFAAEADFYGQLTPQSHHRSIVYVGPTQYNDKPCHEIRMTTKTGEVETHFIDATTYLPAGWIGNVMSNMGPIEMTQIIDAFDTFDGVVIPIKSTADIGGMQEMITTVTEVSFDKLPPDTFDPPDALKNK